MLKKIIVIFYMWKSIKNKFEAGDIHADCTRALVALMGSDQPQLFYHREKADDGLRFFIHYYGDILVGIKIPHVDTRNWRFSQHSDEFNLVIDGENITLDIQPDKFTYLINKTHPLVFVGHSFKSEIHVSTAHPYIDFVWANLRHVDRLVIGQSNLIYHLDKNTIVSKIDNTSIQAKPVETPGMIIPNLKFL